MTATSHQSSRSPMAASASLWSISLTVILASITHAYDFGAAAFVVAAIVIAILAALSTYQLRTGSRLVFVLYGLLCLWVIGGFGVVGGVWNHAGKLVVMAAHGGALPPPLERFFMSPEVGSVTYEAVGVLTGVASVFAAYFNYRRARAGVRWGARADAPGHGVLRSTPGAGVQPEPQHPGGERLP